MTLHQNLIDSIKAVSGEKSLIIMHPITFYGLQNESEDNNWEIFFNLTHNHKYKGLSVIISDSSYIPKNGFIVK